MKKLLVTLIAGILMVNLTFAATDVKKDIKDRAETTKEQLTKMEAKEQRSELLRMIKSFERDGKTVDAEKVLKGLEKVYGEDKAKLIETLSIYTTAKDSPDKEIQSIMDQVRYALKTTVEAGNSGGAQAIAPILGAARLALTEMDSKSSQKLLNQVVEMNQALHLASKPGSKLNLEDAALLAFANNVEAESGKGVKAITDVSKVSKETKEKYEKFKNECK